MTTINFALASAGGTFTATSEYSPNNPIASAFNGDRTTGGLWDAGGGWLSNDDCSVIPQVVTRLFPALRRITEINIFGLRSSPQDQSVILITETTTLNNVNFLVEYQNQSGAWATVPGGNITGNNKVWTQLAGLNLISLGERITFTQGNSPQGGRANLVEFETIDDELDQPAKYRAFGDSITFDGRYVATLAARFGLPVTNYGVSGAMVGDLGGIAYGVQIGNTDLLTSWFGANDERFYNSANANQMLDWREQLTAALVWLSLPASKKVIARNPAVAETGVWVDTGVWGIGRRTVDANTTITFSVTGSAVCVSFLGWTANAIGYGSENGTAEIYVDGVLKATTNTLFRTATDTQNGSVYQPKGIIISGLSNTTHSVMIKNIVAGQNTYVDFVAGINPDTTTYLNSLRVGNIIRQRSDYPLAGNFGSDANVAAMNGILADKVAELRALGLPIKPLVDLFSAVNDTTHLDGDGLHLNTNGHNAVADTFAPIPGVIGSTLHWNEIKIPEFYKPSEPDWDSAKEEHKYQDLGRSFNELTDAPPIEWEIHWAPLDRETEAEAFRNFNDTYRRTRTFSFIDKKGVPILGCRIKSFAVEYPLGQNRSDIQRVKMVIVKYF